MCSARGQLHHSDIVSISLQKINISCKAKTLDTVVGRLEIAFPQDFSTQ